MPVSARLPRPRGQHYIRISRKPGERRR